MRIAHLNIIKRIWNQKSGLAQRKKAQKEMQEAKYNHDDNRTGFGKRPREDDEYHTPDPTTTHKITHKVSHPDVEGGKEHNRTVTISNSTKTTDQAKKMARDHLLKQGYKIHEETELDEARMSAAVKLQRAFEREQQKSAASRERAKELLQPKKEEPKKVEEGTGNLKPGWMLKKDPELAKKLKAKIDLAKKRQATYGDKDAGKSVKEETISEGAYEKAEENKRSADAAKKQGDMFAHHLHMADHHDNLAQWHAEKGRHGEADRHAEKSEKHHEEAMKLKEEVAVNNVGDGKVAGTQGDAGKKAVMTKQPLKRNPLKTFKEMTEECDCWKGYKRKPGTKPCEKGSCVKEETIDEAAIDAKGHKSSTGGLTQKGVDAYNRENPGHHLQTAVTTKPSKLDPDSKDAKRRKSFCARMSGVKGPMKDENGKPTRKALALRKWNC